MHWKSYFIFSKNERIGLMIFLVLMGIFLAAPYWVDHFTAHTIRDTHIEFQLMQIENDHITKYSDSGRYHPTSTQKDSTGIPVVKHFNPNSLEEKDWIAMGIPAKTAHTLHRYTEKGGRFRKASDLYKIWGIRASDVQRLLPYVRIESAISENVKQKLTKSNAINTFTHVKQPIDINEADSADWESLPGIGPVLAGRIIHYRKRCSGFQTVDAIRSVYGLSDTVFQKILPLLRVSPARILQIKKPDINQLSVTELQRIGSLSREVAQAIVLYRKQHGNFERMADLRKLVLITDSLMSRLAHTMEVSSGN